MPEITIRFNELSNDSMQVGDILYYTRVTTDSSSGVVSNSGDSYKIGAIKRFGYEPNDILISTTTDSEGVVTNTWEGNYIVVADLDVSIPAPTDSDFFYFKKNENVEQSGAKGYYAMVVFGNHSREPAELFSFGCNISEVSK